MNKIQYFKIIKILLILLILFFFTENIQAKELCDCYGFCTLINSRYVNSATKELIKVRDGFNPDDRVDIDHKLPLCLGGTNNSDNLQVLKKEEHNIKTQHDLLLLYYVKNCYMTLEEAQEAALKWR